MAGNSSARERILSAAEELFAEAGFDATPTSRVAERAGVPKGLVHYYFRRKQDLLTALVRRLPDGAVDARRVVVVGDIAESLRRLVAALDARLDASPLLSHLLWREADTHAAVREALHARYRLVAAQVRQVILAAGGAAVAAKDVDSASALVAHAVSYRHSVARHAPGDDRMDRELSFVAAALR
ncbi:TetR/AcrR family transcriptional regulator [Saccharothrix australiensis]|uniref:TetR family transcriptional regulator n=1 Tax=Saccharothrix australiensis TaxID=2072 RepID=A0A495W992_9PSEU|nr:TetR/AcrR family transcriptional regulator [Saccharothrix australiensis]RKT57243.1 TetR family transcriptional regulator [Saccharothrix australiensis]